MAVTALSILIERTFARSEVTGPVVGFVRVTVAPGLQLVTPTVGPRRAAEGEKNGPILGEYVGEDFRTANDANEADWIGCTSDRDDVVMMWRDTQGEWHDLLGNVVDPDCAGISSIWLDLVLDTSTGSTRELTLSGEVIW